MVSRIVGDYNHSAPGSDAGAAKAFHERKEGHAIELVDFPAELKFSIPQPHRAKNIPHSSVWERAAKPDPWSPVESTSGSGNHAAGNVLRPWPRDLRSRLPSVPGVFFMRLLPLRIGLGNTGARLAQPKAQLPEQTLALTYSQVNLILSRNPGRESFAIP